MYAVGKLSSYISQGVYTVSAPFHPFGGAVDIIVVQQEDGSFKSSPWYVRFGKFQGVLKTREKVVNICVNGVEAEFHMYLDHKGEAYFLKDFDSDEGGDFLISPPSSGDELDEKLRSIRFQKSQSCNYDAESEPIVSLENGNTKIITRTSSRRSRILGLVFGRRSMKENDKGGNVERANSMDRAEIAADLLETRWSTNIQGSNTKGDNRVERTNFDVTNDVSDIVTSYNEGTNDNFETTINSKEQVDEVEIHNSSVENVSDIGKDLRSCMSTDKSRKDEVGTQYEKLDDNLRGKHDIVRQVHFEEIITHTSTPGTREEVLEVYTLESGSKVISDPATSEGDEFNTSSQESSPNNFTYDAESPGSNGLLDRVMAAPEEKYRREGEFSSFSHTETIEGMSISSDVPMQTQANIDLSSERDVSMQHCTKITSETNEHACEETSMLEPDKTVDKESRVGRYAFEDSEAHSTSKVAFDMINDACGASILLSFSSPESEVIYREREGDGISHDKVSRIGGIDFVENRCQMSEDASSPSNFLVPVHNAISIVLNDQDQENVEKASLPNKLTNSQCECRHSEDEQFLFSDIDNFSGKEIKHEGQIRNTGVEADDVEEHKSEDTNNEECFESVSEISGTQTSPLAIPRSNSHLEETECFDGLVGADYLTKSLPIIRSQIHDLERSELYHQLSCSLDLSSENYDQDLQKMEISSSSKLETGSEGNGIHDSCMSEAAVTAIGSENNCADKVRSVQAAVELSLSKHLLFEGMGADAASRVFNLEKVNVEKFSTLGPSIVKNDKLVVRIEGRYFPWDAAAPIILGMLCFGQENKFEPQGMIAVDREEQNFSDPLGAIVPAGGSWRLWPFSLKKSQTLSTPRSAPESTNHGNVKAVPARSQSMMGHDDTQRAKFAKKQVQSLTPTSQQLASLNLKEGCNMITFNFSTAMLGQQQVDARIYLWKWNTRIVISDVDGTITKSDVLGQFMPLVGKDWSQSGVAHLFSAIKENGYQFLFLSARAISQAYLTRQFLLNLKQDGKALPDGPVVISPDGLFPSLYREVIRRAPHEFKIACLEDIRALFPPECNPFYAGFGNRDTDEISYLRVGIPKGKIFIINPKGEVAVNRRVNTKSYTSLHALVHGMFPPMSSAEQEDFNSWNYWKLPLPDVDV